MYCTSFQWLCEGPQRPQPPAPRGGYVKMTVWHHSHLSSCTPSSSVLPAPVCVCRCSRGCAVQGQKGHNWPVRHEHQQGRVCCHGAEGLPSCHGRAEVWGPDPECEWRGGEGRGRSVVHTIEGGVLAFSELFRTNDHVDKKLIFIDEGGCTVTETSEFIAKPFG